MTESDGSQRSSAVARSAGTVLLSRLAGLIELAAQPAYIYMFGLPTYGLYAVLWAAVNLAQNCLDWGMPTALQRILPQARSAREGGQLVKAAFLLGVAPSFLVAASAPFWAGLAADALNVAAADRGQLRTAILLFVWAIPLWSVVEVGTSALRASHLFGPEIRLRLFWEQTLRLALAALLWMAGIDTLGLLIAHMASLAITAGITVRLLRAKLGGATEWFAPIDRSHLAEASKTGLALLPLDIIGRSFADAPAIVLNLVLPGASGAAAAGLFTIARKVSSVLQLARSAFSYVVSPLTSLEVREDKKAVAHIYGFATRVCAAVTLPVAAVLLAGGSAILTLFGPDAPQAYPMLAWLVVGRAFDGIFGQALAVQQVLGSRLGATLSSLAGLLAGIAAGALFWPVWGSAGIAAAVAVGLVVANGAAAAVLAKYHRMTPFGASIGRFASVSTAAALLAASFVAAAEPGGPAVQLAAVAGAGLLGVLASLKWALPADDARALRLRRR